MATAGHKAKGGLTIAVTLVSFALVLATCAIVLLPLNLAPYIVPPKAEAYAVEADRAAARGDVAGALKQTRAESQVSPMRADAWLRVATLDARLHGHLTQTGMSALSHAFDVAPYDLTPDKARDRFVSSHYNELPADLRAEVDQERAALSH
jgi:hypothetical protein